MGGWPKRRAKFLEKTSTRLHDQRDANWDDLPMATGTEAYVLASPRLVESRQEQPAGGCY